MTPLTCRLLGHRMAFGAERTAVVWWCRRCGGNEGRREYSDDAEARRFAARLNRGAPGPPVGLLTAMSGTVLRRETRPED